MERTWHMILCDTNIYLELFKGNKNVLEEMKSIGFGNIALSDISIGEIYFGMRKGERRKTKELIKLFRRLYFSKEISKIFIEIMSSNYGRKIFIPDALIASFAKANNMDLFTLNVKDFKHIQGLNLYKPKEKLI